MTESYLAIYNGKILAQGEISAVVRKVKTIDSNIEPIVINEESCKQWIFSWQGDAEVVLNQIQEGSKKIKRGRPKLGVTSKEVTLLPRHWEWLATQRGGASVALRRLVDEARKNASIEDIICMKQQQLDGFMMLLLGDASGFEEASRALYRNSKVSFEKAIAHWPEEFKKLVLDKFNEISKLHLGNSI